MNRKREIFVAQEGGIELSRWKLAILPTTHSSPSNFSRFDYQKPQTDEIEEARFNPRKWNREMKLFFPRRRNTMIVVKKMRMISNTFLAKNGQISVGSISRK